jgi:hypothetical protein
LPQRRWRSAGGPLGYLYGAEDAFLDEEPLGGGGPPLVAGKVAVVWEGFYVVAVLVRRIETSLAGRHADDGVG